MAIDAIDLAWGRKPDVLLMSTKMPGLDSFMAVERIHEESPRARIIFLVEEEDEDIVSKCLEVSARGCIPVGGLDNEVLIGIRQVASGFTFFCVPVVVNAVRRMCDKAIRLSGE